MADTHETIADIIAEMRGMGNYQRYSGDHARVLANRLEAAQKRELAVYVLAIAKLRGALVKCRDIALLWQVDEAAGVAGTTDKPHARSAAEAVIDIEFEINAALFATATAEKLSAVGDAAKLREALAPFPSLCDWLVVNAPKLGIPDMVAKLRERGDKARAALSAPPRNCDIGSAEEQWRRFCDIEAPTCRAEDVCHCRTAARCFAEWAQKPYEEGGAK